jgi:DNA-binding transcriptional MerR regulator
VDKSPDAFRTISEVAEDLDLPQHVLRFWETRFAQIRPMKRGGGRRYYRPDDVELLRGIRHLLYGEGYTIKGVQRILKEQGVRFVMEIWRNPGAPIPDGRSAKGSGKAPPDHPADRPAHPPAHPSARQPAPVHVRQADSDPYDDDPDGTAAELDLAERPDPRLAGPAVTLDDEPLPAGILAEGAPSRTGIRLIDRLRGGADAGHGQLSREDIRRLQATLFELLECKRLLDQTR